MKSDRANGYPTTNLPDSHLLCACWPAKSAANQAVAFLSVHGFAAGPQTGRKGQKLQNVETTLLTVEKSARLAA